MASNKPKQKGSIAAPTFPVWVGNLHESVTEEILMRRFSGFGPIVSCTIMKDGTGRSKKFGYVNFSTRGNADRAAAKLAGFKFNGTAIKTKGPSSLRKEGHLKQQKDYRLLTDCSFFMNSNTCTKGKECPYRHSETAKSSFKTCDKWLEKKCRNKSCPMRHPRQTKENSLSQENLSRSFGSGLNLSDLGDSTLDLLMINEDDNDDITFDATDQTPPSPGFTPPLTPPTRANFVPYTRLNQSVGSTQSFSASDDSEEEEEEEERFEAFNYSDDEEEEINDYSSLNRLVSMETRRQPVEEDDLDSEDEETEPAIGLPPSLASKSRKEGKSIKSSSVAVALPVQLEPVGLFWDIENCPVPVDKSAFAFATKLRTQFFAGKREAEFMCVCDITKERKDVIDDLHKAHVTIIHVNAIAKNAADDKLRQSLRKFANTYTPPATVILISGDVNFSPELNDLHHVHNLTIILVHNSQASEALKVCAHRTIEFNQLMADVPPPKQYNTPQPTKVFVKGLPKEIEVGKIRNRLSRLADNCGGKVMDINRAGGTAQVLFKNEELAKKAQKRMNGEEVYGKKITVVLQQQNTKRTSPLVPGTNNYSGPVSGGPIPYRPGLIPGNYPPIGGPVPPRSFPPIGAPRPLLGGPPFIPPPAGGPPFIPPPAGGPTPLIGGPRPPPIPPGVGGPYRPPPPFGPIPPAQRRPYYPQQRGPLLSGPPLPQYLPSAKFNFRKLCVKGIPAKGQQDFPDILSQFTSLYLSANIKCERPVIHWHKFSEVSIVINFDIHSTAETRKDMSLLKGGNSTKVIDTFVDKCVADITLTCKQNNLQWIVVGTISQEQEDDIQLRSNVISLLRKYEKHWCIWNSFKISYAHTYQTALSVLMIHNTCSEAVELLSASSDENQVIIFANFSPVISVNSTLIFQKNVLSLLEQVPKNRIKFIEFVEAYESRFGAIPKASRRRKRSGSLQEVLSNMSEIVIRGMKTSTLSLELREKTPQPMLVGTQKEKLEAVTKEFTELILASPDKQIQLKVIQQVYQTHFHKSIRVSDILPGETGMGRLLNQCPGLTVKRMKGNAVVMLSNGSTSSTKATGGDRGGDRGGGGGGISGTDTAQLNVEKFRKELIEVLSGLPGHSLELQRLPEEFSRRFQRSFLLSEYGAKKTVQLLQELTDVIQVQEEGTDKRITLIQERKMTKSDYEKRFEELLFSLPNHKTTLDKFLYHYEQHFSEKLESYCGYSKLITLLEDMKTVIEISGNGPQRVISLVLLREFACEMRQILLGRPDGLILPLVVPEYKQTFGKDFKPEIYGKKKLLQVLEDIPGDVEVTGEGAKRIARLKNTTVSAITSLPSEMAEARRMFLNQILSLLEGSDSQRLTLEQLSERYYETFKVQINFNQLGYTSLHEAVRDLPVEIFGKGSNQEIQLVPKKPKNRSRHSSENKSDTERSNTPSKKKPQLEEIPVSRLPKSSCLRLCSDIHYHLLVHSEHTMTLVELCEALSFDPTEPKEEDLWYCVNKYNGARHKHRITQSSDIAMVSLHFSDSIWKLGKDLQYLFVYRPTKDFTISVKEMEETYQQCYGRKLNPRVYGFDEIKKLMKSKHLKSIVKFDEENSCISLSLKARYEVFSLLASELLFREGPKCKTLNLFVMNYRSYFGVPLLLEQLNMESIELLVNTEEVSPFIKIVTESIPYLEFTSRGLFSEQLRHLLTKHDGHTHVSVDLLSTIFLTEFHRPDDPIVYEWLRKPLKQAHHVINIASEDLVVWSPTGRPYPDTRRIPQSLEVPDHLKANIDEMFSVHNEMASHYQQMVEEPLPGTIDFGFLDSKVIEELLVSTGDETNEEYGGQMEDKTIHNETANLEYSNTTFGDDGLAIQSNCPVAENGHTKEVRQEKRILEEEDNLKNFEGVVSTSSIGPPNSASAELNSINFESGALANSHTAEPSPSQGLNYGQFAGMKPESVVELMRAEINSIPEDETQRKVRAMQSYIDYFGELSARELERVEGPQKPRSKGKRKHELAIRFPGQTDDLPPSDSTLDNSEGKPSSQ